MGKKQKKKVSDNTIALNRKARYDYEIIESFECGLVLKGTEVKALREGKGNITESYGVFTKGEMFLLNAHISEYSHGNQLNHDPRRTRKLLMHKEQIRKLELKKNQEGLTLVPLKLYWARGNVKVEMGLAKGKKKHDKRATEKDRDWKRHQHRLLKN